MPTEQENKAARIAEHEAAEMARLVGGAPHPPAQPTINFPQRPPAPRIGHVQRANDRLLVLMESLLKEHQQTNQALARTNQLLDKIAEALG